jgi:hypothetical protein
MTNVDLGCLRKRALIPELNPRSINNIATHEYALEHQHAMSIHVPILLVGLRPEN